MTLDEFVNKYDGEYVRGGQCGELVRQYWIDVDQTTPPSYPDSKDYWYNDVPSYDKVSDPQPGDIAIYDGHKGYPEGHSAIYYDGRVFEQNADPDGSPAHLFNRTSPYLLGYLRKQGEDEMSSAEYNELSKYVNEQIDSVDKRLTAIQESINELAKGSQATHDDIYRLLAEMNKGNKATHDDIYTLIAETNKKVGK
jgi:hypothetical protein